MIYITEDESINFEDYNYIMKTFKYPGLPSQRNSNESVIGRSGNITFKDGFNNKTIRVTLTAIDDADINVRRDNARYLEGVLTKPGKLTLDYERDIFYLANVLKGADIIFNASFDTISIEFDCDTFALSRINDNIPWNQLDVPWNTWGIPWEGDPSGFDVIPTDVIEVYNRGNIEAMPIIILDGVGDITLTHENGTSLTYTGLNGIINIDTRNLIVYDDSLVNAISGFSGDMIHLDKGNNNIIVSGSFSNINVEFENKDYFV